MSNDHKLPDVKVSGDQANSKAPEAKILGKNGGQDLHSSGVLVAKLVARETIFLGEKLSREGWSLELSKVSGGVAVFLLTTKENAGGETLLVRRGQDSQFESGGENYTVRAILDYREAQSVEISVFKDIREI
jgi:hypothetical protein